MSQAVVRSRYGTQHHLTDLRGLTWCGLTSDRTWKVDDSWAGVEDQDRCHRCIKLDPTPMPFHLIHRGMVLPV
jgi:hypothetical protein